MPITFRNGQYYVSVGGREGRFRKCTQSLAQARLWEDMECKKRGLVPSFEVLEGQPVVKSSTEKKDPPKKLSEMCLGDYVPLALATFYGNDSKNSQFKNLNNIVNALGPRTRVQDVTIAMIREATIEMADMGNTGATINRKLSALSRMLSLAFEDGVIPTPIKMPRRKESDHRIRWFDREEEARMVEVAQALGMPDIADLIVFGIDTGFRKAEILGFKFKDYRAGMLHLHADETKTDRNRSIPATKRVEAIIKARKARNKEYLFEGMTEYQLRKQWEAFRSAMGKDHDEQFIVHSLRHTCASRLAIAGVDVMRIKDWLGHTTIATTQRYMHLSPKALKVGASALEGYMAEAA